MDNIKNKCELVNGKRLYLNLRDDDIFVAPRNADQMYKAKYIKRQKNNENMSTDKIYKSNYADVTKSQFCPKGYSW